jgi:hypothetical protein
MCEQTVGRRWEDQVVNVPSETATRLRALEPTKIFEEKCDMTHFVAPCECGPAGAMGLSLRHEHARANHGSL